MSLPPLLIATEEYGLSLFHCLCLGDFVHLSAALEEERLSTEHMRRVVPCQDEGWLTGAPQTPDTTVNHGPLSQLLCSKDLMCLHRAAQPVL